MIKDMKNLGMEVVAISQTHCLAKGMVIISSMDFQIMQHPNLQMWTSFHSQLRVLQVEAAVVCLVVGSTLKRRSLCGICILDLIMMHTISLLSQRKITGIRMMPKNW